MLVNGIPLGAERGRRTLFFEPDGPGIRAADGDRRARRGRQRHGAAAVVVEINAAPAR